MSEGRQPGQIYKQGTVIAFNTSNKMGTIRPTEKSDIEVKFYLKVVPEDQRKPEPKAGDVVEFAAPPPTRARSGKLVPPMATIVTILERSRAVVAEPSAISNDPSPGEDAVSRWLPLYEGLGQRGQAAYTKPLTAHTGLLFDKFCDVWAGPNTEKPWKPESPRRGRAAKQRFLSEIAGHMARNDTADRLVKAHRVRQKALIAALGGRCATLTTDWRFVSGLGMGHPMEAGFVWHRALAVPYLPGSSVKGLIRSWAKGWQDSADPREIDRLFGARGEGAATNPSTGSLIVFDALPVQVPRLDVDIINPHYAPYYQEGEPPADYHKPVPIFFLAVASGQIFDFALAPRPGAYHGRDAGQAKSDLDTGMRFLEDALTNIGVGGKTAVGYGYFKEMKA